MRRIFVKPIEPGSDEYIVMEHSLFAEFIDDIRRYGWRVALWNLRWWLTH